MAAAITNPEGALRRREARSRLAEVDDRDSRYRLLFETIDDGFSVVECIVDANGQVIDWIWLEVNPAFEVLSTLTDVVGRRASELLPSFADNADSLTRAIATGVTIRSEADYSPGIDRWFRAHFARVGGSGSRTVAVRFEDITDRKRAEEALRESEQRLKRVLETDAVAVLFFSPDGALVDANDVFLKMTGYSREDVEGGTLTWQQMTPLEYHAESQAQMHLFAKIGRIGPYEKEYFRKDGTRAWMLFAGRDLGNGTIAEIGVDITDRKRAEAALRDSESRLALAIDIGGIGHWELDLNNRELTTSVHCRRTFGRPEHIPFSYEELIASIHPADRDRQQKAVEAAIAERSRFEVEYRFVTPRGETRWAQIQGRYENGDDPRLVGVSMDVTERKRAEEALRGSEERQAFLLKLSDTLRPLTDPVEITAEATRILGEYMQADRTFIAMMEPDGVNLDVRHEYLRPGASSVIGHHDFDQFGTFVSPRLIEGHIIAVEDITTLALTPTERAHYASVGIAAYLLVPLVRNGRFTACFTCNHQTPRQWSEADRNIVRETADRTWVALERARAEAELRESEERFAQFAKASSAGIWIRDAATLAMEYVSPAVSAIYGVERDAFLGDMERWAAMIVPEDRAVALEHIAQARRGESVIHEFRIQRPSDGTFRWIRNTDFPLELDGKVQRIGGLAEDVTEEKLNVEHQAVLLAELQHRVRNIMAIIRSIVARTADGAADVADYAELLSGRLLVLARVQALLTRAANAKVGLAGIVHDELSAQAAHSGQFDVAGPDVLLSPKAAETMTLAVHELTTNALKYGALSGREGVVTVRWEMVEKRETPWLKFSWVESGAPPRAPPSEPRRVGFGSELIEGRIPYELKGHGKVVIEPGGARCDLEFPLKEGASVLETDAPQRATVFGGVIDMSGQADLRGQRVLVLEDDYYLATDTARALRGAGAEVIGPCASERDAREEIADNPPTCAVLDVNLGEGRSFDLARNLSRMSLPFVFITGYDQNIIPDDLSDVKRLQKPVQFTEIVGALADVFHVER